MASSGGEYGVNQPGNWTRGLNLPIPANLSLCREGQEERLCVDGGEGNRRLGEGRAGNDELTGTQKASSGELVARVWETREPAALVVAAAVALGNHNGLHETGKRRRQRARRRPVQYTVSMQCSKLHTGYPVCPNPGVTTSISHGHASLDRRPNQRSNLKEAKKYMKWSQAETRVWQSCRFPFLGH